MTAAGETAEAGQRRKLYGRSKGKQLRPHQSELVRELLPRLEVAMTELAEPARLFAFAPREVHFEIGFGGGEHLARRAQEAPDIGFIGCEPFVNGVAKLLATIEQARLSNVRVHMGDALELVGALAPGSLQRIYVLYPDPWPKRRQRKRRLVGANSIAAFARALAPGGEVRFATDIDDYAGWTLKRFLESPEFRWKAEVADDWRRPWEGWSATRYEAKARAAGRASVYLTFVRL